MPKQQGFVWTEVLIATGIFLLLASVAVPQGYNLWRRAALDYETVRLANDLRDMFRDQRTVIYDRAYFDTVLPQEAEWFSLIAENDGYRVENRKNNTLRRHRCLPGIHVALNNGGKTALTVNKDGYTVSNNTVVVYYGDGDRKFPLYGKRRYVIVDTAGRVRIDWRAP